MAETYRHQDVSTESSSGGLLAQTLTDSNLLKSDDSSSRGLLENCVLTLCGTDEPSEQQAIVRLLMKMDSLAIAIADVAHINPDRAIELTQIALAENSNFDQTLVDVIKRGKGTPEQNVRLLDVLERVCTKSRRLQLLLEIRTNEPRVRSKLVLMIGRLTHNSQWLREQLLNENPRVRANAVESFWNVRNDTVKGLLYEAAADPHHRVAANAALALYRMEDADSVSMLCDMLRHDDEMFRRAALWAVGLTNDIRFLPYVEKMLILASGDERASAEKVIKELTRQHAAVQFLGKAPLTISESGLTEAGQRYARFQFAPTSECGWLLRGRVGAVNFAVTENGAPIEKYSFKRLFPSQNLIAAMVLPSLTTRIEELVRTSWDNLGASERLALVPCQLRPNPFEKTVHGDLKAALFSSDVSPQIEILRKQPLAAQDMDCAIETAMDALESESGDRHLFLVVDPQAQAPIAEFLTGRASELGITVHATISDATPYLAAESIRELTAGSGGTIFNSQSAATMIEQIFAVRAQRTATFEVSWTPLAPELHELKLRYAGAHGYGEARWCSNDNREAATTPSVKRGKAAGRTKSPRSGKKA